MPLYLLLVATPIPLGLFLAFAGDVPGVALSLAAVAAMAFVQHRAGQFMGTRLKPISIWLSPLGGLLWAAIVFHSALATLSGRGVFWKGRHLPAVDP